jgi:hypothetical protein
MANSQEPITLVYDCIDFVDNLGRYISFGDTLGVYIPDSFSEIDEKNKTIEIPLWLAIANGIECYEE